MSESTEPIPPPQYNPRFTAPPVIAPEVNGYQQSGGGGPQPPPSGGSGPKIKGPLGGLFAAIVAGAKWIIPALKGGKFLLTGLTMIASMWAYSLLFGWPFAALVVLGVFVHEMGHVVAAAALGLPVSAPIFLPFMGALITVKRDPQTAWRDAILGIGGPIGGTLAGLVFLGLFFATGNGLYGAAAYFTFFLNLFNMVPLYPLDGGRVIGAVSPYIWIIGLALMIVGFVTGYVRNPMILILVIMAIPHLMSSWKSGSADRVGGTTTKAQRVFMGLAYVGLCGFLFMSMELSAFVVKQSGGFKLRQSRPRPANEARLGSSKSLVVYRR